MSFLNNYYECMPDFYSNLPDGRCNSNGNLCKFAKYVGTGHGWGFLGCYHAPYTGKRVSEIKDCSKYEARTKG